MHILLRVRAKKSMNWQLVILLIHVKLIYFIGGTGYFAFYLKMVKFIDKLNSSKLNWKKYSKLLSKEFYMKRLKVSF